MDWQPASGIPDGFREVRPNVFESDYLRVFLGDPTHGHSCDQMGCGSVGGHVVRVECILTGTPLAGSIPMVTDQGPTTSTPSAGKRRAGRAETSVKEDAGTGQTGPGSEQGLPPEEWRELERFEGYSVSNYGRVCSSRLKQVTILRPWVDHRYERVRLSGPKPRRNHYVHVLVAEAFHGPPPSSDYQVDHIDNDPLNNCEWNLQYLTRLQNSRKMRVDRGLGPIDGAAIRRMRELWQAGWNYEEIAREFQCSGSTVKTHVGDVAKPAIPLKRRSCRLKKIGPTSAIAACLEPACGLRHEGPEPKAVRLWARAHHRATSHPVHVDEVHEFYLGESAEATP